MSEKEANNKSLNISVQTDNNYNCCINLRCHEPARKRLDKQVKSRRSITKQSEDDTFKESTETIIAFEEESEENKAEEAAK